MCNRGSPQREQGVLAGVYRCPSTCLAHASGFRLWVRTIGVARSVSKVYWQVFIAARKRVSLTRRLPVVPMYNRGSPQREQGVLAGVYRCH